MNEKRTDLYPTSLLGWLWKLAEESGEVLQAASKLQRFGPYPQDVVTGAEYDNVADLREELDDLELAIAQVRMHLRREYG